MENLYSLNILLVDDKAAGLKNNNSLPAIINDSGIAQYDEITKYFHVQWLQSAMDVKEFKVLSAEIEDKFSQSQYVKHEGYLPEIIGFDYSLLPGYQSFNVDTIRHIMPTIKMAKRLKKSSIRDYNLISREQEQQKKHLNKVKYKDKTSQNIGVDDNETSNKEKVNDLNNEMSKQGVSEIYNLPEPPDHQDNFGCFGGGLITLQFRNHPCVGIPFTSKDDSSIKGTDAGIFEWFLSQDFAFQQKHRIENKKLTWHELVKNGVIALREKIVTQVQSEMVKLDINQLIKFSNFNTPLRVLG
jgi:hypothetical protein